MRFRPGIIIVLLATLGVVSGCANLGQEAGGNLDHQMVSDLVTERTITRAFFAEPRLAGTNIIVGCVDGVVTLGGSVSESSQAMIAEDVARSVAEGAEIRNAITS